MAENHCIELLKNGVYSTHITTQTANQTTDYKFYFSSDEFRNDFKEGKVSAGIGITIEGLPIKLDYGSSDTEIHEFQKKIRESVNFKMDRSFFLHNAEKQADKNLINGYNDCLKHNKLGFDIWHERTNDEITFTVKYSNFGDLPNPILESVYFLGKTPSNRTLEDKKKLAVNSSYSFTYKIDAALKDATFIIDTNLSSQSYSVNLRKKGVISDNTPIGTIISSFLSWDRFQVATDSNSEAGPFWKSEFSYWSPCDGRKVPKSSFEDLTSENSVPDLRGVFLRGLNVFDQNELHNGATIVSDLQKDTDSARRAGSFQNHELQSHTHTYLAPLTSVKIRGDGGYAPENPATGQTAATGGLETRPKNVAIYYYIRIN